MSLLVALLLAGGCKADADCTVTEWRCCNCPEQHAVSKAELKEEEDRCAVKKCAVPDCQQAKRVEGATAVCKAGACELSTAKPAAAECATAADCQVWCCPQDLASFPKGKKAPGCKRCPAPIPASECSDGKCAVAPHAMPK